MMPLPTLLFGLSCCASVTAETQQVVHVAVDGGPQGDGSAEKPLASLHRAVQAIRSRRLRGTTLGQVEICIRGGRYTIDTTGSRGKIRDWSISREAIFR